MSLTQKAALPLIETAKSKMINVFPECKEMICDTEVHLISQPNTLKKKNEIAANIGAPELQKLTPDHMETLIGETQNAIVVYYLTIDDESNFVHYLIHEFGHVISIRAIYDLYRDIQNDTALDIESKRRAGSAIWSEFIAEYIALDVDPTKLHNISWEVTDLLQHYLDEAVDKGYFDTYWFSFYLANYYNDTTIKDYLRRYPGAAIGLDKYDDDLLEILSRVIALLNEQLCKDDYWIIDEKTLVNLGDSFDELWAYCENRDLTKKLNYLNNSD